MLAGEKVAKERVTVMVCASITVEKKRLLVIEKNKKPRCLKGVARLPVNYDANSSA
jgi:hypothetical protein